MLLEHGMKVVKRVLDQLLLVKCNFILCLGKQQLMLCLPREGCKKSVLLKKDSSISVL